MGLPEKTPTILSGHSLGGVMVGNFLP